MVFSIVFYLIASLLIASCFYAIFTSSPINAGLALIVSFFLTAIIYVILNQEFIAAIQVLVYAGAIMVLFLFIMMLLNLGKQEKIIRWNLKFVVSLIIVAAFAFKLISVFVYWDNQNIPKGDYSREQILEKGSIELFSQVLFYKYILAFEFISLLLLVAAVGTFVLGKKNLQETKQ